MSEHRQSVVDTLTDVAWTCARDWSGWQYGTMGQDDFAPAWEDDGLVDSLTALIDAAVLADRTRRSAPDFIDVCSICGYPEGPHSGILISPEVMRLHSLAALQGMSAFVQVPAGSMTDPDATVPGGPEFVP